MRWIPLLFALSGCEIPPDAAPEPAPEAAAPAPQVNEGTEPQPDATRAQICADDGLLLTRYDFHTIKHRFKELCCGADGIAGDARCEQPWPFAERPKCSEWEDLRNHMFARYGFVWDAELPPRPTKADRAFAASQQRYKDLYDAEPWYQADPDFTVSQMSIVAKRNEGTLRRFLLDKHECDAK